MEADISLRIKALVLAVAVALAVIGCGKTEKRPAEARNSGDSDTLSTDMDPYVSVFGMIALGNPGMVKKRDWLRRTKLVPGTNCVARLLVGQVSDQSLDEALAKLAKAPAWTVVNANGFIDLDIAIIDLPALGGPSTSDEVEALIESWRERLHVLIPAK